MSDIVDDILSQNTDADLGGIKDDKISEGEFKVYKARLFDEANAESILCILRLLKYVSETLEQINKTTKELRDYLAHPKMVLDTTKKEVKPISDVESPKEKGVKNVKRAKPKSRSSRSGSRVQSKKGGIVNKKNGGSKSR
jgi:hypothetical protein